MAIVNFENLIAWQKAQDLAVLIYQHFGASKDFGFRDQICRAVVSVSNNVAEGFNRKTKKDQGYFFVVARSSCSEVKSMIYLARRLNMIDEELKSTLLPLCDEVTRLISGFSRSRYK